MIITDADRVRRLLALPEMKPSRAAMLSHARIACIGVGGLGTASALYLAMQGVGTLTLVDPDTVDATNLSRQPLYDPSQVSQPKVFAAQATLARATPEVIVHPIPQALQAENCDTILGAQDLIMDGLDTGASRDVLNRWAVRHAVPVVFAGAVGYEAMVFTVGASGQPCLHCLFGTVAGLEQECSVSGVLGPVVGLAGTLAAAEALKVLLDVGSSPFGRLWTFDLFSSQARVLPIPAAPDCPVCSTASKE